MSTAKAAVETDLMLAGVSCSKFSVSVDKVDAGIASAIQVHVSCSVRVDGTELLGLLPDQVSASSIEVLDTWRIP